MSLGTLLHKSLGVALDAPVLQALSLGQMEQRPIGVVGPAHQVLLQYFTLTGTELVEILGDSFIRGLTAIDDELNGGYLGLALEGKLKRGQQLRLKNYVLDPFAVTYSLDVAARRALCLQLHRYTVRLLQLSEVLFPATELPDPDMAELLASDTNGFGELLLERIEQVACPLPEALHALLSYRDVLGDAVLYFFREILGRDARVDATRDALLRVGLRGAERKLNSRLVKLQQQQTQLQTSLTQALLTRDRNRRNLLMDELDRLDDLLASVWAHQARLHTFQQQFADWGGYLDVYSSDLQQAVATAALPADQPLTTSLEGLPEALLTRRDTRGVTSATGRVGATPHIIQHPTAHHAAVKDLPFVHGWDMPQIQHHQQEFASELGIGPVFRDSFQDGSLAPEMVLIPPGRFLMGSPDSENRRADNERQHGVSLSQPFALGKYPVTFIEYDRFCIATGREQPGSSGWGRGRRPVINVSWYDAMAYCQWLSVTTGRVYRLPSEAEWEYACRAGTTSRYHFGDTITIAQANFQPEDVDFSEWIKDAKTTLVDQFPANPWGLHDCHGNVFEWTGSEYDKHYSGLECELLAVDAPDDIRRVVRGGSWYFYPWWVHSAARFWLLPDSRNFLQGFRLARSL